MTDYLHSSCSVAADGIRGDVKLVGKVEQRLERVQTELPCQVPRTSLRQRRWKTGALARVCSAVLTPMAEDIVTCRLRYLDLLVGRAAQLPP